MEKRKSIQEDYKTRTLKSNDGRTITYFNGVLHNWDGPALKYDDTKKKDEYYLYAIQKTKDEWLSSSNDTMLANHWFCSFYGQAWQEKIGIGPIRLNSLFYFQV